MELDSNTRVFASDERPDLFIVLTREGQRFPKTGQDLINAAAVMLEDLVAEASEEEIEGAERMLCEELPYELSISLQDRPLRDPTPRSAARFLLDELPGYGCGTPLHEWRTNLWNSAGDPQGKPDAYAIYLYDFVWALVNGFG